MSRPSILHALAEPLRSSGEFATSMGLLPLLRLLPGGDGHPVVALPGFMASDRSTVTLRRALGSLGYETYGWGLGRNLGPTDHVVGELPALIDRIAHSADSTVSLVGWSLGGSYARHLATRTPDLIRTVVTMGTPVRSEVQQSSNAPALFDALRAVHVPGHPILDGGHPLPVPVTAIHTRSDGIVNWRTCLVEEAPNASACGAVTSVSDTIQRSSTSSPTGSPNPRASGSPSTSQPRTSESSRRNVVAEAISELEANPAAIVCQRASTQPVIESRWPSGSRKSAAWRARSSWCITGRGSTRNSTPRSLIAACCVSISSTSSTISVSDASTPRGSAEAARTIWTVPASRKLN